MRGDVERPDDSGQYDDATLLDMIAERFAAHPDPITQRDAAWLVSLAERAIATERAHPLKWADCSRTGCTHTLGDALAIDRERSRVTDALVNDMVSDGASLRDIVTTLAEREMTDAEFATALYALGWFDAQMRG